MLREDAKKHLEVIKAFADGKTIEIYSKNKEEWMTIENPCFDETCEYRVKPEPVMRSYKSKAEFLQAFKEHGPFMNINESLHNVIEIGSGSVYIYGYTRTFESLLSRNISWCDGTKCGIIEN